MCTLPANELTHYYLLVICRNLPTNNTTLFLDLCPCHISIFCSVRLVGRPGKKIPLDVLENFIALKVPVSKMASSQGVSRQTIYNEMRRHGINYQGRFSSHNDEELKTAIINMKTNHPNAGQVMVQGHLQSKGITVQRKRLRETLKEGDPLGTFARQRLRIKRRVYSVPCPNYIWHIDGNHKLIRWGLVLHHGIDGFSRLVVFGRFSDNNRASTVYQLFMKAVDKYHYPFRVRTDYGGENVEVWRAMVAEWGEDSGSVVVGGSVHNQRIERHNLSVNENVIERYKHMFYQMEAEGILNPDNSTDIFCLHYVLLPRINRSLMEFIAAHNNHPVSTEGNKTPSQMFFLNLNLTAHILAVHLKRSCME